jgi:hypothetical protein
MSVVIDLPPNLDAIDKVIPGVKRNVMKGAPIYFCYGDKIYNPSGVTIAIQLIAHECVHALQTIDAGGPEKWWDRYLNNRQDRLDFELEAHCVEYEKFIKDNPARAFRRRYLASCAERLAGPLYGNMLKKDEAKRLIKGGSNE